MSHLVAGLMLAMCCTIPGKAAPDLAAQRAAFKQAWAAAQHGDLAKLTPYLESLSGYPLYPYLRFAYLDATLAEQPDDVVQAFLKQQWALPVADDLRQDWLLAVARRGDWKTFLANYRDEDTPPLRCAAASAHLAGDDAADHDNWVTVALQLWLSAGPTPDTCTAAFAYLEQHQLVSVDMRLRRVTLALRARQYALAKTLLPALDDASRSWAQAWLDMAADPRRVLAHDASPDTAPYQEMLIAGVRQVARRDPARARHLWHSLQQRHHFAHDDEDDMQRLLALQYAWHLMPDARRLLAAVERPDFEVLGWRVRCALRAQDWPAVLRDIDALGRAGRADTWQYWKARALAATGKDAAARDIYQSLAVGNDYYALLAADRLQQAYAFPQQASMPAPQVMQQLALRPAFLRARELVHAGLYDYAQQEWQTGVKDLSDPAQCQAALLASEWGWYGRTIQTFANAGCWQDATFNYPLGYRDTLLPALHKLHVDPAWVYGLIRAESLFFPGAVSGAGAMGLMQLMPSTGRDVAQRLGLTLDEDRDLLDPHTSLTLGSHYMSRLLERFHGSEPLATAAYNAGATRVTEWLPPAGDAMPADVWVDSIPYDETRAYVRRVLAQAVVFDWRLDGKPARLTARLGTLPTTGP
ncbi:MAG TPA: transglycosylase SLT domain-containing protein [Gammaproteobacteria bacterium]|nr:transglycosylase SLT domain-containing protein [Gammaproteobacteria bacterium]